MRLRSRKAYEGTPIAEHQNAKAEIPVTIRRRGGSKPGSGKCRKKSSKNTAAADTADPDAAKRGPSLVVTDEAEQRGCMAVGQKVLVESGDPIMSEDPNALHVATARIKDEHQPSPEGPLVCMEEQECHPRSKEEDNEEAAVRNPAAIGVSINEREERATCTPVHDSRDQLFLLPQADLEPRGSPSGLAESLDIATEAARVAEALLRGEEEEVTQEGMEALEPGPADRPTVSAAEASCSTVMEASDARLSEQLRCSALPESSWGPSVEDMAAAATHVVPTATVEKAAEGAQNNKDTSDRPRGPRAEPSAGEGSIRGTGHTAGIERASTAPAVQVHSQPAAMVPSLQGEESRADLEAAANVQSTVPSSSSSRGVFTSDIQGVRPLQCRRSMRSGSLETYERGPFASTSLLCLSCVESGDTKAYRG